MSSKSARRRERLEQTLHLPEPAAVVAALVAEPPASPPPQPQTFPVRIRVIYEYTHDARRDA